MALGKYGHKSWQYNLLLRLHSNPVQITLGKLRHRGIKDLLLSHQDPGVLLFIDVIVLVVGKRLRSRFIYYIVRYLVALC